jgi:hypothetical protein
MTRSFRQVSMYGIGRALGVAMAALTLSVAFAAEARAGCFANGLARSADGVQAGVDRERLGQIFGEPSMAGQSRSIVGLWRVAFLVGDGPAVAYEGFQQWHKGGTEVMVDNGVPPSLGNVCVGVWKQTGNRTFSLRHVTFNWDGNGQTTGTFQVLITVRLDRAGRTYAGTYVSDSFDLQGNRIPELHAEGRLRATRITVE